jgi:hypothetical protein
MSSTEQPKTLIEELGFTPWAPDYILVYRDEIFSFYPDLFKDRNFTRMETFEYEEDQTITDHYGSKPTVTDRIVVVMLSVSYRKKREDYERDLASLPTDIIQAANLVIGLKGNKVKYFKDRDKYFKDRDVITADLPIKQQVIDVFNADLNKWLTKGGINN